MLALEHGRVPSYVRWTFLQFTGTVSILSFNAGSDSKIIFALWTIYSAPLI